MTKTQYRNSITGVVWAYEEIKEEYERFKREMEDPKDCFDDYLAALIQKGDLQKID